MTVLVLQGDHRCLPLPDGCVDLVVTSPPYFGLRSYTDGGEHYDGQIGSEATPAAYIEALVACTREWVRVLKPSGSLFVNLGDKYQSTAPNTFNAPRDIVAAGGRESEGGAARGVFRSDLAGRPKSLAGLPWRYALAVIDQLGLILRAEIVWAKPNGLPESVTDRVRRAHEQVFHFTVRPRYYSAVDEIREPHQASTLDRNQYARPISGPSRAAGANVTDRHAGHESNPLGKLPGSVWSIPSQPLTVPPHLGVDHFAAFPMELPRRLILGWSPAGICTGCGEGRRPVHDGTEKYLHRPSGAARIGTGMAAVSERERERSDCGNVRTVHRVTGYACACPQPDAPTRPSVILDPFGGTGTTALLAAVNGRHGITVDRSADYCRIARWRTTDPGERARAMQVDKPAPVHADQQSLFDIA